MISLRKLFRLLPWGLLCELDKYSTTTLQPPFLLMWWKYFCVVFNQPLLTGCPLLDKLFHFLLNAVATPQIYPSLPWDHFPQKLSLNHAQPLVSSPTADLAGRGLLCVHPMPGHTRGADSLKAMSWCYTPDWALRSCSDSSDSDSGAPSQGTLGGPMSLEVSEGFFLLWALMVHLQ